MKNIIFFLSFLFVSTTFAQERNNNSERENNDQRERSNLKARDTSTFTFNNEAYIFTPEARDYIISRIENDKEEKIGKLFNTTSDGYYIMTTTPAEPVSFGKFDEEGNFRSYRYDRELDSVIEENFEIQDPIRRRDEKGRNDRERKENRSNNRNERSNN